MRRAATQFILRQRDLPDAIIEIILKWVEELIGWKRFVPRPPPVSADEGHYDNTITRIRQIGGQLLDTATRPLGQQWGLWPELAFPDGQPPAQSLAWRWLHMHQKTVYF